MSLPYILAQTMEYDANASLLPYPPSVSELVEYAPPADASSPWPMVIVIGLVVVGLASWALDRAGMLDRIPFLRNLRRVMPAGARVDVVTSGPNKGAPRTSYGAQRDGFTMEEILARYDAHPVILTDHVQDFIDAGDNGLTRLRAALADTIFEAERPADMPTDEGEDKDLVNNDFVKVRLAVVTDDVLNQIPPHLCELLGLPKPKEAALVSIAPSRTGRKPLRPSWRPDEADAGPTRKKSKKDESSEAKPADPTEKGGSA